MFGIIGMWAMMVSIRVLSIAPEGAVRILCLLTSLRKPSLDSICFTVCITVVLLLFSFFLSFQMHLSQLPFQIIGVSAYYWALSAKIFMSGWLLFCSHKCSKTNAWFTFCTTLGEVGESFVCWFFLCLVNFFWDDNDFPHSGQAFDAFDSFFCAVCLFRLLLTLVS